MFPWHGLSRLRIPGTTLLAGVRITRDHCRKETPSLAIQFLAFPTSSKDDLDLGAYWLFAQEWTSPLCSPEVQTNPQGWWNNPGWMTFFWSPAGPFVQHAVLHTFSTPIKALCLWKHCSPHFMLTVILALPLDPLHIAIKSYSSMQHFKKDAPLTFKDTLYCFRKSDLQWNLVCFD